MNNISTSECISGCDSGWTTYWDQLSNSTYSYSRDYEEKGSAHDVVNEDSDDHLSMVSDASSAPTPNLHQNYASSVSKDQKDTNKQKNKIKKEHQFCQLDDTATSPVFHFYQDNVAPPHENQYNSVSADHHVPGFSQQFSAAHFEGENIPKKHLGFFKSSKKRKSGSLLGRKGQ